MILEPKPIFLMGIPAREFNNEGELELYNDYIHQQKESLKERMPDYHVIVYTCEKVNQMTFSILTTDGKQSNL